VIVCEEQKLLYLCPPKTGTVSVLEVLTAEPFRGVYGDTVSNHHNTVWDDKFQDWFIFITTRHPYTRAVSLWRYGCGCALGNPGSKLTAVWRSHLQAGLPSLEGFLLLPVIQRMCQRTWGMAWHTEQLPRPVDLVIRQETLNEDIRKVPGLESTQLRRRNVSLPSRTPWHSHYTKTAIELVNTLWGKDFELFGYNPDFDACASGQIFTPTGTKDDRHS
jgi:hypothetical protein